MAFAWKKGKEASVETEMNKDGSKTYKINGSIFFGSVLDFKDFFNPISDPQQVFIDFEHAKVMDYSGIEAVDAIVEKYDLIGKNIKIINLNDESRKMFEDAKDITKITIDSPSYS